MKLKKAALPFLLVLLLAQAGCSKGEKYNITGAWSFLLGAEEQFAFTFQGSSREGTLSGEGVYEGYGTYTVTDGVVEFQFRSTLHGGKGCNFLGAFVSEDRIDGNLENVAPYPPFTWTFDAVGFRKY
jgi:hypothetical protein